MRFDIATVTASLATRLTFDDPEDSFRLLRAWRDADPGWFPERLDSQEPIREPISPDAIEESRARRFGLAWNATRRKPRLLAILMRGVRSHGSLGLDVYEKGGPAELAARTARLLDAWATVAPPDYGMVHHLTLPERLEAMAPWRRVDLTGDENGAHAEWGFTVQLRRGLPTLYWRNLFGPPYIALLGRERLLTAPAFAVEERPWGIALQLTPEVPSDATYPAYREARERVIDHVGRDVFIDGPLVVPLEPHLLPVEPTAARVPVFDFPTGAGRGEAGSR